MWHALFLWCVRRHRATLRQSKLRARPSGCLYSHHTAGHSRYSNCSDPSSPCGDCTRQRARGHSTGTASGAANADADVTTARERWRDTRKPGWRVWRTPGNRWRQRHRSEPKQ